MNGIDTRKTSASIAEVTVSLFDAVGVLFMGNPLWARQIIASEPSNRLNVTIARSMRGFQAHLSKICTRRAYDINRS
jgi:hypothetical protein